MRHPTDPSIPAGLSCQKCGCQDESLRLCTIPYTVSLIYYSSQKSFRGRWCRRHRLLYTILAALITGTIGWMGIPFGVLYAIQSQFNLLRERIFHKGNNSQFLESLVQFQLQRDNYPLAQTFLEARFHFIDDEWGRQELIRLDRLNQSKPKEEDAPIIPQIFEWLGLALAAFLSGNILGMIDMACFQALADLNGLSVLASFFILIGLGSGIGFLLWERLETIFNRRRLFDILSTGFLCLITLVSFLLGILQGWSLVELFSYMYSHLTSLQGSEIIISTAAALSRGWIQEIIQAAENLLSFQFQLIHFLFFILLAVIVVFMFVLRQTNFLRWRTQISQIIPTRGAAPSQYALNSLAVLVSAAAFVLFAVAIPQSTLGVDILEAQHHYQAGINHEYDGDVQAALNDFQEAVQILPDYIEANYELGWCLYINDDYEKAAVYARQAIAGDPQNEDYHYLLGDIYYFSGEFELSEGEYNQVIAIDPEDADAYNGLGWAEYYLGNNDQARLYFEKALQIDPGMEDASSGLGNVLQESGNLEEALEIFQTAAEANNTSGYTYADLGLAQFSAYQIEEAVVSLEKALGKDPDLQYIEPYLMYAYLKSGQVDEAVEHGNQLVSQYPEWAGAYALLADALLQQNQYDLALAQIDTALSLPDISELDDFMIVSVLIDAETYDEALDVIQSALEISYYPADFYIRQADVYAGMGDFDSAYESLDQAKASGADEFDLAAEQAYLAWYQEDDVTGMSYARQGLEIDPQDPVLHGLMSEFYYDQDNIEMALKEAEQAVTIDSYYFSGYLNLAAIYSAAGQMENAVNAGKRAVELSPYDAYAHFVLGMIYFDQGQNGIASQELNQFLDLYQPNSAMDDLVIQAKAALDELIDVY